MKITNHDLHIMLTEMKSDIKGVAKDVNTLTAGFDAHIANDAAEFKTVNDNINNMNKYASSIAIVAGVFGAIIATGWEWVRKKVGIA